MDSLFKAVTSPVRLVTKGVDKVFGLDDDKPETKTVYVVREPRREPSRTVNPLNHPKVEPPEYKENEDLRQRLLNELEKIPNSSALQDQIFICRNVDVPKLARRVMELRQASRANLVGKPPTAPESEPD